jgi:hypothetical protein
LQTWFYTLTLGSESHDVLAPPAPDLVDIFVRANGDLLVNQKTPTSTDEWNWFIALDAGFNLCFLRPPVSTLMRI